MLKVRALPAQPVRKLKGLQSTSLGDGTGNFQKYCREYFPTIRKVSFQPRRCSPAYMCSRIFS